MSNNDIIAWRIIDKYFKDNPNILITHHLESYNNFFNIKIFDIIKEKILLEFLKIKIQILNNIIYKRIFILELKQVANYILVNLLFLMNLENIICFQMKQD